jgi:hypothetical protein
MEYASSVEIRSTRFPGVHFRIARISFGRRLELTRQIRELGHRIAFDEAGDTADSKLSAAIARAEIDRLYLDWALVDLRDLKIDGIEASPELLIACGPEELVREIVAAIRHECGLSEDERKN